MANRQLTELELRLANQLLAEVRSRLVELSGDDAALLFAYRRKIAKELIYDERSKPMVRRQLKSLKRRTQNGLCAMCSMALPEKYVILDRLEAAGGYTDANTRLICEACDREVQRGRGYR